MLAFKLLAFISPLFPLIALGQAAPDTELSVPSDHIRIPALVTDKQGKPVPGLRADDFKILDNGKPAPLAAFFELSAAAPATAHFTVFYLDDRHLDLAEMESARRDIDAALTAALDPNGYVAIVTGTGSVNTGFSRDAVALRKTLESIRTTTFASQGTAAHNFDLTGTYASLAEYAARMSKLPGRRLFVMLSPGFYADFPEIRAAAEASIDRIIQSGVVVNTLDMKDPAEGSVSPDDISLQQLSSATCGSFFQGSSSPSGLTQFPADLYLLDISSSAIRRDGSSHRLKVVVSKPNMKVRARESFVASKAIR